MGLLAEILVAVAARGVSVQAVRPLLLLAALLALMAVLVVVAAVPVEAPRLSARAVGVVAARMVPARKG